jgi:hypothetical protein
MSQQPERLLARQPETTTFSSRRLAEAEQKWQQATQEIAALPPDLQQETQEAKVLQQEIATGEHRYAELSLVQLVASLTVDLVIFDAMRSRQPELVQVLDQVVLNLTHQTERNHQAQEILNLVMTKSVNQVMETVADSVRPHQTHPEFKAVTHHVTEVLAHAASLIMSARRSGKDIKTAGAEQWLGVHHEVTPERRAFYTRPTLTGLRRQVLGKKVVGA